MIFGSKQTMHLLYGVDFEEEDKLLGSLAVTEGSLNEVLTQDDVIILPQPVAERLGVLRGDPPDPLGDPHRSTKRGRGQGGGID